MGRIRKTRLQDEVYAYSKNVSMAYCLKKAPVSQGLYAHYIPATSEDQPSYHLSCQHNENKKPLRSKNLYLISRALKYQSNITYFDFESAVPWLWSGKVSSILMLSRHLKLLIS